MSITDERHPNKKARITRKIDVIFPAFLDGFWVPVILKKVKLSLEWSPELTVPFASSLLRNLGGN